jgi:hypothetical protein
MMRHPIHISVYETGSQVDHYERDELLLETGEVQELAAG